MARQQRGARARKEEDEGNILQIATLIRSASLPIRPLTMTSFAVWVVRNDGQNFTWAPKPDGNNPAESHREPNTSLSEHECDVRQWITRRCSCTFNLIFLSNCGWYNVRQSFQGQGNKVIDAQGQGSRTIFTLHFVQWLEPFPSLSVWGGHINNRTDPEFCSHVILKQTFSKKNPGLFMQTRFVLFLFTLDAMCLAPLSSFASSLGACYFGF